MLEWVRISNISSGSDLSAKSRLRHSARARRKAAFAAASADIGGQFADRFLAALCLGEGAVVAGYAPTGSEADCLVLLGQLHERGHPCCLPVIEGPDQPLGFLPWAPGMVLEEGPHRIRQPIGDRQSHLVPDVVIVPLVAFDRTGHRLGQGGGYYDRTLAALRARHRVLAVGLGFEAQGCDRLDVEPHDRRLDWVVTEKCAYCFVDEGL